MTAFPFGGHGTQLYICSAQRFVSLSRSFIVNLCALRLSSRRLRGSDALAVRSAARFLRSGRACQASQAGPLVHRGPLQTHTANGSALECACRLHCILDTHEKRGSK